MSYWLNFGEDGPWQWWWYQIRSGCLLTHKWKEHLHFEEGIVYESYRECERCGQWGGYTR